MLPSRLSFRAFGGYRHRRGRGVLYTTNFKAPLLKHVRLLTISTHNSSICSSWLPYITDLLPDVQILRTAPTRVSLLELHHLCTNADGCDLLAALPSVTKVVFRNVDGRGLGFTEHRFPSHSVKDVVIFLPTDGRVWSTTGPPNFLKISSHYPNANIKLIFHATWEDTPLPAQVATSTSHPMPVACEPLIASVHTLLPTTVCAAPPGLCLCGKPSAFQLLPGHYVEVMHTLDIYGIGKLRFVKGRGYTSVTIIQDHRADTSPKRYLECVKEDILTSKYSTAAMLPIDPVDPPKEYTQPIKEKAHWFPALQVPRRRGGEAP